MGVELGGVGRGWVGVGEVGWGLGGGWVGVGWGWHDALWALSKQQRWRASRSRGIETCSRWCIGWVRRGPDRKASVDDLK